MAQTIQLNVQYNDGGAKESLTALDALAKQLNGKSIKFNVDATGLDNYTNQIKSAAESLPQLSEEQTRASKAQAEGAKSVKTLGDNTEKTAKQTSLLGDSLGAVATKMLVWQVMGRLVSAPLRAISDAVKELKEVDTELVTIRKVTGATVEESKALAADAYDVATRLGTAASEYLNSVAEFAKAGYGDTAADLGELAVMTAKVGDVQQDVANQFLLSVDKAYQFNGSMEELTRVLDGANEIGNKFATDVEHIAQGLGIIAPVAAQAHVGVNELTAAIGTISAVTQRSGAEASRALRALFLNIMGDTKTEIEDGAKWTAGEIEGLRDVLNTYAADVVKAADETKTLINPMEAIAALAKSMKEGVLSEQKLMEMVSDIGGKLRTSQLLALIQNWDMYQEMLTTYAESAGSAAEEYSIYLDSWEAKTKQLDAAWTKFISTLVDTGVVKGALDILISLVSTLGDVIQWVVDLFDNLYTTSAEAMQEYKDLMREMEEADGKISKINEQLAEMGQRILELQNQGELSFMEQRELDKLHQASEELLQQLETQLQIKALNEGKANAKLTESWEKATLGSTYGTVQSWLPVAMARAKNSEGKGTDLAAAMGLSQAAKLAMTLYENNLENQLGFGSRDEIKGFLLEIYDLIDGTYKGVEAADALAESIKNLLFPVGEAGPKLESLGTSANSVGGKLITLAKAGELNEDSVAKLASQYPELELFLDEAGISSEALAQYYNTLYGATNAVAEATNNLAIKEQSIVSILDAVTKSTDAITAAQKDMESQGYLTVSSVKALIDSGLDQYLVEVEGGYQLAEGALEDYMAAQRKEYEVALNEAKAAAENVIDSQALQAQGYDTTTMSIYDQIKAMQKLAQATMAAAASRYRTTFSIDYGTGEVIYNAASSAAKAAYQAAEQAYDEILGISTSLTTAENNLNRFDRAMGTVSRSAASAGRSTSGAGRSASSAADRMASSADKASNAWSSLSSIVQNVLSDYKERLDAQADAIDAQIDQIESMRDAQVQAIQDQIDALDEAKQAEDEALEIEERRLAVEKARQDLLNAQNERTVRYYNAATGQWEWMADQKNVDKAKEALADAEKALADTVNEQAFAAQKALLEQQKEAITAQYDAQVKMLEAQKDAINAQYKAYQQQWAAIQKSLQDPMQGIAEVLQELSNSSVPGMRDAVNSVVALLAGMGVNVSQYMTGGGSVGGVSGVGGIGGIGGGSSYPGQLLKKGMTNDYIKQVQAALGVNQTGYFGSQTYSAVTSFQRSSGLKVDGIVGPDTWGALFGNYDSGGVAIGKGLLLKDTDAPELILNPEMTRKILSPASSTEYANAAMSGIVRPAMTAAGGGNISTHDGATYMFGDIVLTDAQASSMTVKQLAQLSGALRVYGNPR